MIDILIARHEKKSKEVKPNAPGDAIDREQVKLSPAGYADAMALGERALGGRNFDHVYVVTSNLVRTGETAKAILEGAGFDVEKDLYGNSERATFISTDKIGLGGTNWNLAHCPPYGEPQDVLDTYVNHVLEQHWLERNQVLGALSPIREPVMARRGAALLEGLVQGVEEMAVSLESTQNGLLIIVTHAPTIDALAVVYTNNIDMNKTQRASVTGNRSKIRDAYSVRLKAPVNAHNMGQYMRGQLETPDEDKLERAVIPLTIKGKEYSHTLGEIRDLARTMKQAAYQGVQL